MRGSQIAWPLQRELWSVYDHLEGMYVGCLHPERKAKPPSSAFTAPTGSLDELSIYMGVEVVHQRN